MKKLMKVTALLMAAAMTLTACGGKTTSTETGKDTTPAKTESQAEGQTEAAKETKKMRVAYVTAGAQGDNGFTDSVVRGMNRIKDDFGAEITVIENNNDAAKYAESWRPVSSGSLMWCLQTHMDLRNCLHNMQISILTLRW